jgi:hypothetical protein
MKISGHHPEMTESDYWLSMYFIDSYVPLSLKDSALYFIKYKETFTEQQ